MLTSGRGFRCSLFGLFLGGVYLGFGGTAIAWIEPPQDYPDLNIGRGFPAIDPTDPQRLVMGASWGASCFISMSVDGGETWSSVSELPQCAGPVAVTYALSGGIIYAAYGSSTWPSVNFSFSIDQGATWSAPTIVASPLDQWDYLIGLQFAAGVDGPLYVVVSAYKFTPSGSLCDGRYISASTDGGASWSDARHVYLGCPGDGKVLAGFAVAAGRAGDVLVAYGLDRWEPGHEDLRHDYALQIARSADYGASFVHGTADRSTSDVLSSPDITIAGERGLARLVYAKGSDAILYKKSLPPYSTWSVRPDRLNAKVPGASVHSPRLAVGACGNTSILHAAWMESIEATPYDIRAIYRRKITLPKYRWSKPLQFYAKMGLGGSVQTLNAAGAKAFATFVYTNYHPLFNVYGSSWVWSGVTCP